MFASTGGLSRVVLTIMFLMMGVFADNGLCQKAYPNKPVTMVVQTSAGGTIDILTRAICKVAEKELGQPIIIENKPGGANLIAVNYVVRSKPDGYTLGTTASLVYLNSPHMDKVPFNVLTDVTDIMPFFKYNHGLCVKGDAPWNSFDDLMTYAKKNPGKLTYSNPGIGSTMHITMERIAMKEGIRWVAVPFKSGDETVLACLGGHTDIVPQTSLLTSEHIKAGKLKLLLILSDTRWPDFLKVPTILEKGFDFSSMTFGSVYGPKDLPEPIRQRLEDVFKKAMKDPSYVEAVNRYQMEVPSFGSGKEYSDFWRSNYDEMGRVIRALGLGVK